ncbi:hypothetical protein R1sor_003269 [Riccia sorocarpa]|uniref:Uncharacterized protein n=1 Tax=Riccia sorocarpa TaxID=122646 RepID=A0ABD3H139_9MARC
MAVESKPSHNIVRNSLTTANTLPKPPTSTMARSLLMALQALTGEQKAIRKKSHTLIIRRNRMQDQHRINRPTQDGDVRIGPRNSKRQRTVLALDFTDLPKGGPKCARPPQAHYVKPGRTEAG